MARTTPGGERILTPLLFSHYFFACFFRAAFAPSRPRAVRVFFGRCAIVRSRFAAAAAFLMFLRAAALCLEAAMEISFSSCACERLFSQPANDQPRYAFLRRHAPGATKRDAELPSAV